MSVIIRVNTMAIGPTRRFIPIGGKNPAIITFIGF